MENEDASGQPQGKLSDMDPTKPRIDAATLRKACAQLLDVFIEEEYKAVGLEVGRQMKWGDLEVSGVLNNVPDEFQIVDMPGMDIFGNPLNKKYNFVCECPRCHRTLGASRFAPHLEKCMGIGRNSSRIASRRLPAASDKEKNNNNNNNNSNKSNNNTKGNARNAVAGGKKQNPRNGELGSEDDHSEEDGDDEDWPLDRKKETKISNEKVAAKSKKGPPSRVRNTDGVKGRRGGSPSVTVP